MVELAQMTQFMHDHVVDQMHRQEGKLGIEVEIALARAAPPAGFHALELDVVEIKPVVPIVDVDAVLDELEQRCAHSVVTPS